MSILPALVRLTKFQREEYAKVWFDLSKLSMASLIFKFFEPGQPKINIDSFSSLVAGLIIFLLCVRVGLFIGSVRKL